MSRVPRAFSRVSLPNVASPENVPGTHTSPRRPTTEAVTRSSLMPPISVGHTAQAEAVIPARTTRAIPPNMVLNLNAGMVMALLVELVNIEYTLKAERAADIDG